MKKNKKIRFNNKVKIKYYIKNYPINYYYKTKKNVINKKNTNLIILFLFLILLFIILI